MSVALPAAGQPEEMLVILRIILKRLLQAIPVMLGVSAPTSGEFRRNPPPRITIARD